MLSEEETFKGKKNEDQGENLGLGWPALIPCKCKIFLIQHVMYTCAYIQCNGVGSKGLHIYYTFYN